MARPMIKEACMASLLLENPYYILLWKTQWLFLMSSLEGRRVTTHKIPTFWYPVGRSKEIMTIM